MTNALTTTKLPAHLQALLGNTALQSMNADAVKGISSGSWPRISLKGSRFRLQDPQGQEFVVPDFFLDVVLVAVNPHGLSKKYYAGNYDPSGDGTALDCYSDNGVGPSVRATKPQCGTCQACPHNVWGSKITPTGAQVKACGDTKKIAVLLANNTNGPVWELDIPAASLTNFGAYVRSLDAGGIPAASIVTRLSFDTSADYPKLLFSTPVLQEGQSPYITPDMLRDVMEVLGSDEVKQCTGELDKPIDPARVGAAATSVIAAPPATPPQPAYGPTRAPQVAAPLPAMPAAAPQPPAPRTRRKKADITEGQAALPLQGQAALPLQGQAPQPLAAANTPSFLYQPQSRDATAPVNVQHTNPELDALLDAAMRT